MDQVIQQLRPDAKGRINLGKLAEGISSFRAHRTREGNIVLEPVTEIPAREKWLFENSKALSSVRAGLADADENKTVSRGSFGEFAAEDID